MRSKRSKKVSQPEWLDWNLLSEEEAVSLVRFCAKDGCGWQDDMLERVFDALAYNKTVYLFGEKEHWFAYKFSDSPCKGESNLTDAVLEALMEEVQKGEEARARIRENEARIREARARAEEVKARS